MRSPGSPGARPFSLWVSPQRNSGLGDHALVVQYLPLRRNTFIVSKHFEIVQGKRLDDWAVPGQRPLYPNYQNRVRCVVSRILTSWFIDVKVSRGGCGCSSNHFCVLESFRFARYLWRIRRPNEQLQKRETAQCIVWLQSPFVQTAHQNFGPN